MAPNVVIASPETGFSVSHESSVQTALYTVLLRSSASHLVSTIRSRAVHEAIVMGVTLRMAQVSNSNRRSIRGANQQRKLTEAELLFVALAVGLAVDVAA